MTRRTLLRLLHRLDVSPLPRTDPVWLDLELEVLRMFELLARPERPPPPRRLERPERSTIRRIRRD